MKHFFLKVFVILIPFSLFITVFGFHTNTTTNNEYINLQYILVKLTFTSRISTPTEEINRQLISDIESRKVNFILNAENEKELRNAGANDLLIETINKNIYVLSILEMASKTDKPLDEVNNDLINSVCENRTFFVLTSNTVKTLKKAGATDDLIKAISFLNDLSGLYTLFIDNYKKDSLEQKKVALEAAKKFVKISENNVCKDKALMSEYVKYFNNQISILEEWIKP